MVQIQEGLRILQEEAPDVFASMTNISGETSLSSLFSGSTATSGATAATTESTGAAETQSRTAASETTGTTPGNTASPTGIGNAELATLMASLLNVAPPNQSSASFLSFNAYGFLNS